MEPLPRDLLIGAIIAMATVIGYVFKRLFDDSQGAAKSTREAYFEHVTTGRQVLKEIRDAIHEGREQSAREHENICNRLNGKSK